jgi:hypothetical protein
VQAMTKNPDNIEMAVGEICAIVANTPVFIPADAVHTWQRAARAAKAAGKSLVQYATDALIEKLTGGDEILSVWVDEPDCHEERFAGHWVIEPESPPEAMKGASTYTGPDSWSVGLAETSHGRFALALAHYRDELTDELHVFDTFDQLRAAFEQDERIGPRWLDMAFKRMQEWHEAAVNDVVWRDI